jgi:hypothetical protein
MSCIERMIRVISLFITVAMSAAGQKRRIIDITSLLRLCGAGSVAIRSSN